MWSFGARARGSAERRIVARGRDIYAVSAPIVLRARPSTRETF